MPGDSNGPMPSLPGYRLLRVIGSGSSGTVYLAEQLSLGREVAVKVFDKVVEDGPSATRAGRESAVMGRQTHPNVVRVIDHGIVGEFPFLVMDHLPGGSLRDSLAPRVPMSVDRALPIVEAVGRALTAIHEMGFVHRDVKPENVLLDAEGRARLADFGLVKGVDDDVRLTHAEAVVGTIDYMAPEQRHRLPVDARADQFSLAVVAYELLTGTLPHGIPRAPSSLNRALAPPIDRVVLRGLRDDPNDRYSSVAAFTEALGLAATNDVARPGTGVRGWLQPAAVAAVVIVSVPLSVRWFAVPASPVRDAEIEQAPVTTDIPEIRQAAALPFRERDGVTEILLVRSRRDSHWTTAKADSPSPEDGPRIAEEEAFEEAGVQGRASRVPLGEYDYTRGDSDYVVVVHAVEVEREYDEWPEQFRRRRWCTPEEAAELVPSDGLRRVLLSCGERLRR